RYDLERSIDEKLSNERWRAHLVPHSESLSRAAHQPRSVQEIPPRAFQERTQILVQEKVMKIPGNAAKFRWFGLISIVALLAALATLYPAARGNKVYAWQEKEAPRPNAGDQATSLNDQTDLNVTVYNSNIALIRDV